MSVVKNCIYCQKEFSPPTRYGKPYVARKKYCSTSCAVKGAFIYGGRKRSCSYNAIHTELRKNKKTGKCVFCGEERNTQWALKKEREYSHNIDDYNELCVPCHRKYDYTEEQKKNRSISKLGNTYRKDYLNRQEIKSQIENLLK